jgi:hypothetical protein
MSAGTHNITIEQGATFLRSLLYKEAGDAGDPIDLTDWTARAQMRPSADSSTSYDFECVIADDPTTGVITWSMSAEDTAAIVPMDSGFVYDLEIEHTDGTVRRLLQGTVTLSAEVTK